MGGQIKDIQGERFGRLLVKRFLWVRPTLGAYWLCVCECGVEKAVSSNSLRTGRTKSCGCGKRLAMRQRSWRHGKVGSKVYRAWTDMLQRCENPKNPGYKDYGGRGITVCEEWHDFLVFWRDMGEPPAGLSLDRIDNEANYSPENCRWATQAEQNRNSRHTRFLTFQGKTQCLADWAKQIGINPSTLLLRLQKGWPLDQAFTQAAHW